MFAARRADRRRRRLDRLAVAAEFRLKPMGRCARLRAFISDVGALERARVDRNRLEHAPEQLPTRRR